MKTYIFRGFYGIVFVKTHTFLHHTGMLADCHFIESLDDSDVITLIKLQYVRGENKTKLDLIILVLINTNHVIGIVSINIGQLNSPSF